ncbi:MAG: DNA polymerase III subunit chi [Bdellovibrionales bacterium]
MTEIRFYHLERSSLEQALPALVGKAYNMGHKIVIQTGSSQTTEDLSTHLWTYDPNSFLPHGSAKDGNAEHQPIWLTDQDENPNNADVLITVKGGASANIDAYKLCCDMFDGRNENELSAARARWKTLKDAGFTLTYWQQGQNGWEKKA